MDDGFTSPSKFCSWSADSKLAAQARRLSKPDRLGTITEVYGYVSTKVKYDWDKAKRLRGTKGYVPDPEDTYESGKGICFDIASLMCAMLRSLGIPAKLVTGRRNGEAHAWVSAYDGEKWYACDPTFGNWDEGATYEKERER